MKNGTIDIPFNSSVIDEIEKEYNIKYSISQRESFNFIKSSGIKILTGGPGTGKTTVIRGLIEAYKRTNPKGIVALCAPTGRAAQRITESTKMEASTIHRLLDCKPYGDNEEELTCKNQDNPLSADLLIVDEVSMVDTELFAMLLGAVKSGTLIILCGDTDQLPSVGAGNVLKDLIASKQFPVNVLDTVYRQTDGSNIIHNANCVRTGNRREMRCGIDFEIIEVNSEKKIQDKIVNILRSLKYDDINAFQVLTPSKKGNAGTIQLNKLIQPICNQNTSKIFYGNTGFKCGDKIMTIRNNYKLNYFNGDIGVVKSVSEQGMEIEINGETIKLTEGLYEDVSLAYASTIHKSQGSEYSTVIIALPSSPKLMLKKDLLYTAITRAKERVIIIAENGALDTAVRQVTNPITRKTSLMEKIILKCNNL